jgi:nitrite reductase (NO-forming)
VPAGEKVVVHVTNQGKMQHNIAIEGEEPAEVGPGESATLQWGPFTKSMQAWCTVPGHKESGMALAIKVAD